MKFKKALGKRPENKIESYLAKYLNTTKTLTVIDVGAHRGDFINELERFYPISNAALIEPTPELVVYLKSKFLKRGFSIIESVLADRDNELINFKINVYGETSSILEFNTKMEELSGVDTTLQKTISITTRTLDSVVSDLEYKTIDLLKIDVQGVEHLVLLGGKETLKNTNYVWVELSFKPLYHHSCVFADVYALMEANGFIMLELSPGHRSQKGELLQADALFCKSSASILLNPQ